jgi:hypothetical protein
MLDRTKTEPVHLIARFIVGGILVSAALLKYQQIIKDKYSATFDFPVWMVIPLAQLELVLGAMILTGLYAKTCQRLSIVLFVAFGIYNCYSIAHGKTTCNCFGELHVSPTTSLIIDVVALLLLLSLRPVHLNLKLRTQMIIVAIVLVYCCISARFLYAETRPPVGNGLRASKNGPCCV